MYALRKYDSNKIQIQNAANMASKRLKQKASAALKAYKIHIGE